MSSTARPIVFMDIQIGETPAGRLKMELFSDIVPKYASQLFCLKVPIRAIFVERQRISDNCVRGNIGTVSLYG